MRTDHQRRARGPRISSAEIASCIGYDPHTRSLHPALHSLHTLAHRRGEKGALDLARLFGELGEVAAAGNNFIRLLSHFKLHSYPLENSVPTTTRGDVAALLD